MPTEVLPPDPSSVAPPLDPSVATDLLTAAQFLYSGANPIQSGVGPNVIDPRRIAVVRGRVLGDDAQPLPGVRIAISQHPEFGQTLSRADGRFDLVVNGGMPVRIDYSRPGFLAAQRQVDTQWQAFANAPDVALIALDAHATSVDLSSTQPIQVARGSAVADTDGQRQATLLVPSGTGATLQLADGSTRPLSSLTIRASEYTVGANGPAHMPADLPPSSAFTYAVELSADEAQSAGATQVSFSAPLPFYVDNFVGFPSGTSVPLGSYDRASGTWLAADSGVVLQIVSVTGGLADLDVTGDGQADSGASLTNLGITDAERGQLAMLYSPGKSLWRVRIPHFSTWDLNWGSSLPPGAVPPDGDPQQDNPLDGACTQAGSKIECENQILGESVAVASAGFDLHYQSERVPGHVVSNSLDIPLSGATVPPNVQSMAVEVRVGGQLFTQQFAPSANQRTTFTWDGRDAYGRAMVGSQPVEVRTGFVYPVSYGSTNRFASNPDAISIAPARRQVTLWHPWFGTLGAWDARAVGLGGWTAGVHHFYDPRQQVLYRGDGSRESARSLGPTISTYAGGGSLGADGSPANQASLDPQGLAFGPDGTLYLSNGLGFNVRVIDADGILSTIAGTGQRCTSATSPAGDGGPARQAAVVAGAVAVGPDSSVYLADGCTGRVRKISTNGIITTIAGTGVTGFSGDGGPGTQAQIATQEQGLAVGSDGSVYIADNLNRRIRRVAPDGTISTFAGDGGTCAFTPTAPCGDGGAATHAQFANPNGVAVGPDGSVYIADTAWRIRKVTPDGIIRTIAGTGVAGYSGDGGPGVLATFQNPTAVAVGADGSVYIADRGANVVRWLHPDGFISTLAGSGVSGTSGDDGPPTQAQLQDLSDGLVVAPDGGVYVSQTANNPRIRRIAPTSEHFSGGNLVVPNHAGTELYFFTPQGRHVRTIDALSGAVLYQFAYDGAGRLSAITDADGNTTSVQRDGVGNPTAIVGPFGHRTALSVNADGYLDSVSLPAGETTRMTYSSGGLLTAFSMPGGQTSRYAYDASGRLVGATDPTGATKTLTRSGTSSDYTVAITSPLGRITSYRVERLTSGGQRITTTDPAGAAAQSVVGADGSRTITYANGAVATIGLGPDPRFGMRAPLPSTTLRTPSGLVQSMAVRRNVTLSNSADILSLATSTDTVTTNGRTSTTVYSAATHTLTTTTAAGRHTTVTVDAQDRRIAQQVGDLASIAFTYDSRGRLATQTQADRQTRFTYGADGLLASVVDPLGLTLRVVRDADGRITDATAPDGGVTHYAFDANGNLRSVTPPGGAPHSFSYTPRDEMASDNPPPVGAENDQDLYTYDGDRNGATVTRADGAQEQYQYDAAGRLSTLALPSGNRAATYDSASRVSGVSGPGETLSFGYDGALLTDTTWSGVVSSSLSRTLDTDFRVTAERVDGGSSIGFQYDPDSLVSQAGAMTVTHSPTTGLTSAESLGSVVDASTYNNFGELTHYTATQSGAALYTLDLVLDQDARITSKTETLGGATHIFGYAYDAAGRLTEVRLDGGVVATYAYDLNGNRVASGGSVATYDAQDRLTHFGAITYVNTPRGERASKTLGGATTSYRYDTIGNLVGVALPNGTQIDYVVDPADRRIGKRVNGSLVQGFVYADGLRPVAELDGSGNLVSRFVYTGGTSPEYLVRGGATYRIVSDQLGSPRLVIDVATGQVAQRLDYDAFGVVTLDTNPGFQPFGFAGGLYDPQTGLVHFGAREYDAESGRWTSRDPAGFGSGDTNPYAYTGDDPINQVDPTGLTDTLRMGMPQLCASDPVGCKELATAAGVAVAKAAPVAQRVLQAGAQALDKVADMAEAATCRASTIPGAGVGAGNGPFFQLYEEPVARVVTTLQGVGVNPQVVAAANNARFAVARAAALVSDRWEAFEEAFSAQSPATQYWYQTLQATQAFRQGLPVDEMSQMNRWIFEFAGMLFGEW